jgi:hypothetical protein
MSANRETYNINIINNYTDSGAMCDIINNYTDSDAMCDITNNTLEIKIADKLSEIIKTMEKLQYLKDRVQDI